MARAAKTVTVIPPTINPLTRMPSASVNKRRVAGYARVSTDSDEQFTSYEAQIDYYTQYIKRHAEWEFVRVYTDEGISGTNTKHREGFNEMIADALAGKIDLIVTKSVSRFARNTVDSLVTTRKLKEKGVEVYFEKENIYTLDSKGELLITIMSSLAQEESRSLSENITWGQRKRFSDGKVSLPYKHFLGYRKGANGLPEIVEEEAEVVRKIYSLYIMGKTSTAIARQLIEKGIPTPSGKQNWQSSTIESILTNEKYKGDALLQKSFTVDFLLKTKKINEGEVPQYYVENSHPAIIPPEEWKMVQMEIARRKSFGRKYSCSNIFSTRLVCGDCGEFFGAKVWHSTDKYRKVIWQCNHKFKDTKCSTPSLAEDDIKERFVDAINTLIADKEAVLDACRLMQSTLTDCSEIDTELDGLMQEIEVVTEMTRHCIEENAQNAQDQNAYMERYNGLVNRCDQLREQVNRLQEMKTAREREADSIGAFMFELKEYDEPISEFDEKLWVYCVDRVVVHADGKLVFHFRNGAEIEA